jgi:hypothetical protein
MELCQRFSVALTWEWVGLSFLVILSVSVHHGILSLNLASLKARNATVSITLLGRADDDIE